MDILRFITAGSVDDGKSTLIGRLLHDSKLILIDQLAAIEITPETGATIAATLANGGVCPLTNERVLEPAHVRNVLAVCVCLCV